MTGAVYFDIFCTLFILVSVFQRMEDEELVSSARNLMNEELDQAVY